MKVMLLLASNGVLEHHEGIVEYFRQNGVHAIFLFRRNLLRRMISVLANSYDKNKKPLNGTHKSHVHSTVEAKVLAQYKPTINTTTLMVELKHVDDRATRAVDYFKTTRHIGVYYEDVVSNRTKLKEVQEFLGLPYRELTSRQVKIHSDLCQTTLRTGNMYRKCWKEHNMRASFNQTTTQRNF